MALSATDLGVPPHVNVAAGCNLLAKYEDNWKIIHQNNEDNAKKAHEVAKQIQDIESQMNQQKVVMSDLIHCLAGIPNLVLKIKDCHEAVQEVQDLSLSVERELEKLEDLCAECELQEYMLEKQCELSKYKQKKMGMTVILKIDLLFYIIFYLSRRLGNISPKRCCRTSK